MKRYVLYILLFVTLVPSVYAQTPYWRNLKFPPGKDYIFNIAFDSADNVYTSTYTRQYRSTDQGESWQKIDFPNGDTILKYFAVNSRGKLFCIGRDSCAFVSIDNGLSWTQLPPRPDDLAYSFFIDHRTNDLYYGSNKIYRSTNDGASWQFFGELPTNRKTDQMVLTKNGSFLASDVSAMYRRAPGDTVFRLTGPPPSISSAITAIVENVRGVILAVPGEHDNALMSFDDGITWRETQITSQFATADNNAITSPDGAFYVVSSYNTIVLGAGSLSISTDDGTSWDTSHETGLGEKHNLDDIGRSRSGYIFAFSRPGFTLYRSNEPYFPALSHTVSAPSYETQGLSLYPNPVQTTARLMFLSELFPRTCSITDALGREVVHKTIDPNTESYTIDLIDLTPGVYAARVGAHVIMFVRK